jgi:hypothetical protein
MFCGSCVKRSRNEFAAEQEVGSSVHRMVSVTRLGGVEVTCSVHVVVQPFVSVTTTVKVAEEAALGALNDTGFAVLLAITQAELSTVQL